MAQVEFQYNCVSSIIQCKEDQKMYEICNNFINKSHLNENNLHFIYNGKGGKQFDKNLTFNQMANSYDKTRKKMNILVISNNIENDNNTLIKSKNIICPKCGEDIKIKTIENFKIYLFECRNNHKSHISINEFEKTQMINLKSIKCNICKEKNKYNTYNNEFYKCSECDISICPLCKLKHNKEHNIINYDKIHYICSKHNELFTNYCNKCKKNICSLCEKEHFKHDKKSLGNMILEKKDLNITLNELKKYLNIFNENINKIIEVINNVKENMNNYYKLEEYLINNYNKKEINYEILYNINKIINYNDIIINDINTINNENNIQNKFNYINDIYNKINNIDDTHNKINNNVVKLVIKIEKDDVNKKIYFLDNTKGNIPVGLKSNKKSDIGFDEINEEHHHDFLKELNELNTELYINNKKFKYKKYFIPEKEGEYNILLKINILMTDCSFMFYKCKKITNIDLSLFNIQNVANMSYIFAQCVNLTSIELSSFNTQNVINMSGMFVGCSKLENIDLSSFNTENVTSMYGMFTGCFNLTNLDLSSFNTKNVINMAYMFCKCENLKELDLSSFNTQNVIYMAGMFGKCTNLTNINLSSFNTQKVINMFSMFLGCWGLSNINLPSFSTENATNMAYMFSQCSKLSSIDLSTFNMKNVTRMKFMFMCTKLKGIIINKNLGEKLKNQIYDKTTEIIYA